ncbi:MAG: hypothetical protein Q8M83_01910, partial [bacterium]|nr:hypothetical protein [bacterium]
MNEKIKKWFNLILEGLVSNPEKANFGIISGSLDLEVAIMVAPEDEAIITEEVCLALTALLKVATGVFQPVVYLYGAPHSMADN